MTPYTKCATVARWLSVLPAYVVGIGILPVLYVLFVHSSWRYSGDPASVSFHYPVFFVISTLAGLGGTLAAAITAPSLKVPTAAVFALVTGLIPYFACVGIITFRDTHPQFWTWMLGYFLGGVVAFVLVYLKSRQDGSTRTKTVEPQRGDEPSSAGAPEGR